MLCCHFGLVLFLNFLKVELLAKVPNRCIVYHVEGVWVYYSLLISGIYY